VEEVREAVKNGKGGGVSLVSVRALLEYKFGRNVAM
jgi:hypothetical protein